MADKLPSTTSIEISFTEAEIPSPAKLTALSAQLRRVAEQLEKAVGDIHGSSWPYTSGSTTTLIDSWGESPTTGDTLDDAAERDPDIVNLARLIGPASVLNPKFISTNGSIVEDTPIGVHEFSLELPVGGSLGAVTTTDPSMTTRVNPQDMISAGHWSVTAKGKVRSVTATAGGTITYSSHPSEYGCAENYTGARFNVIPDPNQVANGNGVTLSALDGANRRTITLPTVTHQQSNLAMDSIELGDEDPNFGKQIRLPLVLVNNFTSGDEIPSGFLYLKNETTNEVYTEGVYYFLNESSLQVANVDLVDAINNSNVFSVITVGTTITASIDDLRNKTRHSHDRSWGEPFVEVSGIIGQYEDAGLSGVFGPSSIPGNDFAQYLHRDGYRSTEDNNVNDHNAMRGDLVLGLFDGTPGTYTGSPGRTFKVGFGDTTHTFVDRTVDGVLHVYNDQGDIHIETNSALANQLTVDPLIETNAGIVGDVRSATLGDPGVIATGTAPYAASGTVTYGDHPLGVPLTSLVLPADIRAKTWYSVSILLGGIDVWDADAAPNQTDGWVPCGTTANSLTYNDGDYDSAFTIDPDNGIVLYLSGGQWAGIGTIPYRIMIWYQV